MGLAALRRGDHRLYVSVKSLFIVLSKSWILVETTGEEHL
jgi:hypothetical protein